MGQIVQKASNPVRCNLAAIQAGGSQANVVLDDGEVWFVDTTNAEKGTDGYGHYDAYIVGDGTKKASALVVKQIDDMSDFATKQELATKQDVINDLATIRSGADAGATAYQKPNSGIPKTDLASAVQTSLGKADAAAPQSTTYTKTEVDAALAAKQDKAQMATINGSRIDQGGNVTIVAAEGQTITVDAAPTEGSSNAVSSGGVYPLAHAIITNKSLNIYDGNGTINGDYVRGCVVDIDPSKQNIVLSTEAQWDSYFFNTKWIDADGVETTATADSSGYSPGQYRSGKLFTIPSGAIRFKFDYRYTSSSVALLVRKVMVTYGTTIYADYIPYSETNELRNPNTTVYCDAVNEIVYVAPDGNDENVGDESNPFATIQRALQENKRIVLRGGIYNINSTISLSSLRYKKADISAYDNEEPILLFVQKLVQTEPSLMDGSTKVYQVSLSAAPNSDWIFQYGVPDTQTLISDASRTPYHHGRLYRSPYLTAIRLASSIQEIEESQEYKYYYDSSNNMLYFSCPATPSADNFIYRAKSYLFSTSSIDYQLNMRGITVIGAAINPINSNYSVIEGCRVFGSRSGGGFILNGCKNAKLIKCEAAFVDAGANQQGGDGFNIHNGNNRGSSFTLIDCWAHDNNNDGYSDHYNSQGVIDGGLFEFNCISGIGAGICPAYGANDVIKNVIVQNNFARGINYSALADAQGNTTVVFDSISRNNALYGFAVIGRAKMTCINCVSYGNSIGYRGDDLNVECINCKSVGNDSPDVKVDVI